MSLSLFLDLTFARQPCWREKRVDLMNVFIRLGFAGVDMRVSGVTRLASHPIPS